jgi:hypothetical protein
MKEDDFIVTNEKMLLEIKINQDEKYLKKLKSK